MSYPLESWENHADCPKGLDTDAPTGWWCALHNVNLTEEGRTMHKIETKRNIREVRTLAAEIEPRTFTAPPGYMNFHATGVLVHQAFDTAQRRGPRPERDGVVTVKITGYSVKKDGTPGGGSRATTAIYVDLINEWNAKDYGLKWEVAPQHYEEIRAIAERAIEAFHAIDWSEVEA